MPRHHKQRPLSFTHLHKTDKNQLHLYFITSLHKCKQFQKFFQELCAVLQFSCYEYYRIIDKQCKMLYNKSKYIYERKNEAAANLSGGGHKKQNGSFTAAVLFYSSQDILYPDFIIIVAIALCLSRFFSNHKIDLPV